MKTKSLLTLIFIMAAGAFAYGQQLTYTPKNPAFGGDPFAGNWLLNMANAQNPFDDDQNALPDLGTLAGLDQSLSDQLAGFGEGGFSPGTTSEGNFEIEAFENLDGLILNILNTVNGEQTQIVIPNN